MPTLWLTGLKAIDASRARQVSIEPSAHQLSGGSPLVDLQAHGHVDRHSPLNSAGAELLHRLGQ